MMWCVQMQYPLSFCAVSSNCWKFSPKMSQIYYLFRHGDECYQWERPFFGVVIYKDAQMHGGNFMYV